MKIIVTGGTGLIGRALCTDLASAGHSVIVLSRNPNRATGLPASVRVEKWDARTAHGWGTLADGADAIVNLAGASIAGEGLIPSRWTPQRKRLIRESRLDAGKAVVEAVEATTNKPRVVIQSSGIGIYGPRGDEEITEDAAPGNDFLAQVGVEWEASTAAVENMGVRRAIIRTAVVLSAEGGILPRLMLPFQLFAGGQMGNGQQWLPWIHITDEVRAIRFLIENEEARGAFNLVAPQSLTNADFGRALARALGRPFYMPAPAFALKLALGELSTLLLDGQRAVPRRLQKLGFDFQYPELDAALRELIARS